MAKKITKENRNPLVDILKQCRDESIEAKRDRMDMNKDNFDCYHLKQDWSHKIKGQSREFLAKQAMAVEQLTAFLQQGLVDTKDWFGVEAKPGVKNPLIRPDEIKLLLKDQLDKAKFPLLVSDAIKAGALGSLMIVKVHGKMVPKVSYETELESTENGLRQKLLRLEKDIWQMRVDLIRQEDYEVDPTGRGLYEIQRIWMDYHELVSLAEQYPDDYDMAEIEKLQAYSAWDQTVYKARETGQNVSNEMYRKAIAIDEYWGDVIEPVTGKLLHKNIVMRVANERHLVSGPRKNPFWHQMSPFIAVPIIRVPHSVWHKALMDAPTKHNRAMNELYNLQLDGGFMSVFGIKQIREDWLEDPSQVAEGVPPGITLQVNTSAPVGAKVMERVDTGTLSQESITMFNITDREFISSSLTNDVRMGNLPSRTVKATEIVASNQALTGITNGIVKNIEFGLITKILELGWMNVAQFSNDFDSDDTAALIGKERAMQIASLSPEQRFAATAMGHKFNVFGLSDTLNKINDFRKITAMLQTISGSQILSQAFAQKYDFTKLLDEILRSLDVDTKKIEIDQQPQQGFNPDMIQSMISRLGGQSQPQGPNQQSQIPQAATGPEDQGGMQIPRGQILGGLTNPGGQ